MDTSIGNINFRISFTDSASETVTDPGRFTDFNKDISRCDSCLNVTYGVIPQFPLEDYSLVFANPPVWSIYRTDNQWIFMQMDQDSNRPYFLALLNHDFSGEVFINPEINNYCNPLEYPFGEVLMISLLSKRKGIHVHACGVEYNGEGYLFLGNSGAGKTTMAKLWEKRGRILNDDRIILRHEGGKFWMYATPWHGDYDKVSAMKVPLRAMYILHQAISDTLNPLTGIKAHESIITRSFLPHWEKEGMGFSLDFIDSLVHYIPVYDLGFAISENVVETVLCAQ